MKISAMRRFFYNQPHALTTGETVPVTEAIFHHWCKVLRADVGDTALFFDGQGGEYTVTLSEIGKKNAFVQVESFNPIDRDLPYAVHIGLVMSRGERMDYAIQKATELGVTAIHLLTSERCEVRLKSDQTAKKVEHWQAVAIAACEQCGLNRVPTIIPPQPLTTWVAAVENAISENIVTQVDLSGAISDNRIKKSWLNLILAVPQYDNSMDAWQRIVQHFTQPTTQPIGFCLLIGCEGGLSRTEIALAEHHRFLRWQIGERVLRTETAPVIALSALNTLATLQKISHLPLIIK